MEVIVMKKLLEANDKVAEKNRKYFRDRNILAINLMGSPGSGKTSLISAVAKKLPELKIGVVEGDISSSIDAQRLQKEGIVSSQINTCGECHLDASCIREGVEQLNLSNALIFFENVGNLICPAEFDLGENLRLLAASVAEGDDKPFKYVPMFSYVDVVVLTKTDVAEALGFDRDNFMKGLRLINSAPVYDASCKTGKGIEEIAEFLKQKFAEYCKAAKA